MQNFRRKARGMVQIISAKKAAACMLSVAMAAVIFWVFTLTGNTDNETRQMTVAESIRAAGDRLTASADLRKFTGEPYQLAGGTSIFSDVILEAQGQQPSKVSEIAEKMAGSYMDDELPEKTEEADQLPEDGNEEKIAREIRKISPKRETRTIEEKRVIEYPVEERLTSLLRPGEERVIYPGKNGSKTVVCKQELVDGEVVSEEILSVEVHQKAVMEIKWVGATGTEAAISPLDFGIELDEYGVPTQYTQVLTNQIATGYNAGYGAWGASGQTLSAGYVAVHPGEIPYGTRMYITSPDNSFVYGFAVAADTGVSLLGNVIDVDLYYDTYLESCLNGRRNVNIYILD